LERANHVARGGGDHMSEARLRARRSSLILPVNVPRFVERAALRGADALVLAGRGGAEVVVRVNNDPAHLWDDVAAAVHPGLDGLALPKAESPEQIRELVRRIEALETARGMTPGHIRLSLAIETPRGLLRAEAIAAASDRIATMGVGVEDYCLELGVEPSADGIELLYPVARVVTIAKAAGIQPTGLMGSIASFRDLGAFEGAAARARQLGCEGAGCIH